MTKQNMVAPDGSSLFNAAAQRPPAVPGAFFSLSQKHLLQNLEINNGARANTWLDSMRASSPTHLKAAPPLSDGQNSWIVSIFFFLKKKTRPPHTHEHARRQGPTRVVACLLAYGLGMQEFSFFFLFLFSCRIMTGVKFV